MTRIALLAAVLVSMVGCGGGDPCVGSPCPNDARQSGSQYQACVDRHQQQSTNRCYRETTAYELCIQSSAVCDSKGETDVLETYRRAQTQCKQAGDSVTCCVLGLTTCR